MAKICYDRCLLVGNKLHSETPSARMPMAIVEYSYLLIMNLVNLLLVYFLIVVTFYSVRKSFRHTENNVSVAFVMVTSLKSSLFFGPSSPVQSPGFVPSPFFATCALCRGQVSSRCRDVDSITWQPSSLFTVTQLANGCTGHDTRRRCSVSCSEYTMARIFILTFLVVTRHHTQAFWAVLLRVSELNWLAEASIYPADRVHMWRVWLQLEINSLLHPCTGNIRFTSTTPSGRFDYMIIIMINGRDCDYDYCTVKILIMIEKV